MQPMEDWPEVAKGIGEKIAALDEELKWIKGRAQNCATSLVEFKKKKGIVQMQLIAGVEFEVDGVKTQNPPVSVRDDIVNAICYKELLASELAEKSYKACLVKFDAIEKQLNGYQSLFNRLDKGTM